MIDINKVKQFLETRQEEQSEKLKRLFQQAWIDFERIVDHIIKKYEPEKIYQWGSLLNQKNFSEISDIDICIEGDLSPQKFFSMLGEVEQITNFPVHIVEMHNIEPIYAESIRTKGRLVYEKKPDS
jgi:predicted nucleotidyltransferase